MSALDRARLNPEWHAARADLVRDDADETPGETFTRRALAALRLLDLEASHEATSCHCDIECSRNGCDCLIPGHGDDPTNMFDDPIVAVVHEAPL